MTSLDRVRKCGACGVADGGVTFGIKTECNGDVHAGFGGIATCGSVWVCPQCAAVVATRRASELADAIRAVDARGGSALLLSLTMRHTATDRLGWSREQRRADAHLTDRLRARNQALERGEPIDQGEVLADSKERADLDAARGLWDALTDGWGAVTSGKKWVAEQRRHGGMLGWTKVVETTRGANGWHVHVHALICFADDVDPIQAHLLGASMFTRWRRALEKAGYTASGETSADGHTPGWDIRRAQLDDNAIAHYFTKLAHEVTGAHRKEAKSRGGSTPMQLLADAVETYQESALARWWEWETASDGRKQMTWSGGTCRAAGCLHYRSRICRHPGHRPSLRDLARLGDEQTDEEIADEDTEPDERIGLSPEVWGWLRSTDNVCAMKEVGENELMPGVLRWLDDHGQTYITGAGVGWIETPPTEHRPDGSPLPLDRTTGVGLGWEHSSPAVLRPRDTHDRPLPRPSDRPPRWSHDARAVLTRSTP